MKNIALFLLSIILIISSCSSSSEKEGEIDINTESQELISEQEKIEEKVVEEVKEDEEIKEPYTSENSIQDIDGNYYYIVKIGTQTWMAENLATTKLNDGTSISNITNDKEWSKSLEPAYCWYNDDAINKDKYGTLYNYYAVETEKLCPAGWHVAKDDEWKTLEKHLGMREVNTDSEDYRGGNEGSQISGIRSLWNDGKLKSDSTFGNTRFNAIPSDSRDGYEGSFGGDLGAFGFYWSPVMTNKNSIDEYYRGLYYNKTSIGRFQSVKSHGFSVRCVKD